ELFEALEVMKDKGLRRYPIVDSNNELSGFFSLDDVLYLLGLEMSAVARIIEP
ncbi:MAG TPA: CBS domain-containing protein, partial [Trueperaceae bacterium]|nr:CBS domain-containing protein [Trueperaceae bacterium]